MELESYVRSNTAVSHPKLDGQVPKTIMSGQTADISHFAELGWYDWIKFFDTLTGYPEPKEVLGRWLGPAIDIGPAMTSKVLKSNGQVIYTSTSHPLTDDEMADPTETKLQAEFNTAITNKLGAPIVEATAMSTPFRRWTNHRAREEKSNSTLALAQASELIPIFSCPLDSNTYSELF